MSSKNLLDLFEQSELLLDLMSEKIQSGNKQSAINLLAIKLKNTYETGVNDGRLYEREGVFPFED